MKKESMRPLALVLGMSALFSAAAQQQERPAKVINFSGYDWVVKDSGERKAGPGPNYFSDNAVTVTPEGLRLRLVERDGHYSCGEVTSQHSFGHGTYRFTLASNIDNLDPNLVLGLFTWSDERAFAHRELDVEISRWGDPNNDNTQFVVQPYSTPGNMLRFTVTRGLPSSVYSFTWLPGTVEFRAGGPGGAVVKTFAATQGIPEAGGEKAHINFWLVSGRPPAGGTAEAIISKFDFVPAAK